MVRERNLLRLDRPRHIHASDGSWSEHPQSLPLRPGRWEQLPRTRPPQDARLSGSRRPCHRAADRHPRLLADWHSPQRTVLHEGRGGRTSRQQGRQYQHLHEGRGGRTRRGRRKGEDGRREGAGRIRQCLALSVYDRRIHEGRGRRTRRGRRKGEDGRREGAGRIRQCLALSVHDRRCIIRRRADTEPRLSAPLLVLNGSDECEYISDELPADRSRGRWPDELRSERSGSRLLDRASLDAPRREARRREAHRRRHARLASLVLRLQASAHPGRRAGIRAHRLHERTRASLGLG